MKKFVLLTLVLIITACGSDPEKAARTGRPSVTKKVLTEEQKKVQATPSIYYVDSFSEKDMTNCDQSLMVNMLDRRGQILVRTCQRVYKSCLMEGTCLVSIKNKQQLLNVDGKINSIRRFRNITGNSCKYGLGSGSDQKKSYKSMCVDPFYSIAADLKIYNLGDVIYLPFVRGTVLPNGDIHDGYFIVRDTGGHIKGHGRFDFFTGFFTAKHSENVFMKLKLNDQEIFPEYSVVTGAEAERVREQRNFPLLPR